MFVKPTINPETGEPYHIRQPERNHMPLPAAGGDVPANRYWLMHLYEGSIEIAQPPAVELGIKVLNKQEPNS